MTTTSKVSALHASVAIELGVEPWQIQAAADLFADGSTVPFVARYRKEATGGLDDIQLRALEERLIYIRELESRRTAIFEALAEKGITDQAVLGAIQAADTKARLEDLYLPYRTKRHSKVQAAIDAGLLPLADGLLANPNTAPELQAEPFIDASKGVADAKAALDGARAILSDRFSEDANLVGRLRDTFWKKGRLISKVQEGKEQEGIKFSDYFNAADPLAKVAPHRISAMMRGEKENILSLTISPFAEDPADPRAPSEYDGAVARQFGIEDRGRAADSWLRETARWSWRTKILLRLEGEIRSMLWDKAETAAITVFADNLRDLLLAAPAGHHTTLALDPGFRNGVKMAVVDQTGKVIAHDVVHPHEGDSRRREAARIVAKLCRDHEVKLVAIGDGTASRETERFMAEICKSEPDLKITIASVSEAGASVYSASAVASEELPMLDVSIRGAVSIGRRLQDPLAELIKIDPKSIGAGQYQHDVSEFRLARTLDAVVEDCVNSVGVDLNTASPHLLARVAGVGPSVAQAIVSYRDVHGAFKSRKDLLKVPRLGDKAFEQCAGFLRVPGGENPLDASGVHPESYPVVDRILAAVGCDLREIMGNPKRLANLKPERFVDDRHGLPTVKDVLSELLKPGRDPRPHFETARFNDAVHELSDLQPEMILEGTVTNVTAFGAFVNIGVHQDGLVHIGAMADRFISDPREVVRSGQTVKVKVLHVDLARKRIALSMRLTDKATPVEDRQFRSAPGSKSRQKPEPVDSRGGAFADAMKRALDKGR